MRVPSSRASLVSCVTMTMVFFEALLQRQKFPADFHARQRIERAERLVHQQDRRVGGERARHADALALAAGKLVRIAAQKLPRRRGRRARAAPAPARELRSAGQSFEARNERDVLLDGVMREQARFLDHVADVAAQRDGVPRARGAAFDQHFAGRSVQAAD